VTTRTPLAGKAWRKVITTSDKTKQKYFHERADGGDLFEASRKMSFLARPILATIDLTSAGIGGDSHIRQGFRR
jgi:hypothetical protein